MREVASATGSCSSSRRTRRSSRASTTTPPSSSSGRHRARQVPKTHIPRLARASGRSSTSSLATSDTRVRDLGRKVGLIICYDRHFPEVARELGLKGAEIVFNPSATVTALSKYLWKLEQPAHAVANGFFSRRPTASASRPRSTRRVLRLEPLLQPEGEALRPGLGDRRRGARSRPRPRRDPPGARHLAVPARPPSRDLRRACRAAAVACRPTVSPEGCSSGTARSSRGGSPSTTTARWSSSAARAPRVGLGGQRVPRPLRRIVTTISGHAVEQLVRRCGTRPAVAHTSTLYLSSRWCGSPSASSSSRRGGAREGLLRRVGHRGRRGRPAHGDERATVEPGARPSQLVPRAELHARCR